VSNQEVRQTIHNRTGKRNSGPPTFGMRLSQMMRIARLANGVDDGQRTFAACQSLWQRSEEDERTPFTKLHALTVVSEGTEWAGGYQLQR
jgi:hypothetical protein